ncbi:sulfur carrier protein ThiS [Terasakiella sp.]|uniref:Thiamine biosynthesis protein ThiS n=1 Tax=Terasakiella brassicae TaxID=1634917 RepID=A0A917C0M9_9PROT|nr:thiamine biosynthesis protein ThiS [Terasakiella brassicae]
MIVIVNGEERTLETAQSVEKLLLDIGLDPKKVAVERNREIVPKSQFDTVLLEDGDKLEIVHFIGGGC